MSAAAVLIFLVSLAVAYVAWLETKQNLQDRAQYRFELHALEVASAFQNRVEDFAQNLRAMRAMVLSGGSSGGFNSWKAYVDATAQDTFGVGVESMTFLRVLSDGELPAFVGERRREPGGRDFTIHAVGKERSTVFGYVVINYIEPESRQNLMTYGADVATDKKRLSALISACDSGKMAATAPTGLIDYKDETGHLILYLPVYRGKPTSIEDRRRQIRAFVSSAINVEGMIEATSRSFDEELKSELKKGLGFVLRDITEPDHIMQLGGRRGPGERELIWQSTAIVGGRVWSIEVTAPRTLYLENSKRPWLVPTTIAMIGLLVAGLVIALGHLWLNMRRIEDANAALRESDDMLRQLALTDSLTGLGNRRQFLEVGSLEWARLMRYRKPAAVLMIDADHFKVVNDTYGHAAGDSVLVVLAGVLRASLRECDLLARMGGEEFSALLPETGLEAAHMAAERVRAAMEAMQIPIGENSITITISIGVAHCEQDDIDFTAMLMRADEALYMAKNDGRNRVAVFPASTRPAAGPVIA